MMTRYILSKGDGAGFRHGGYLYLHDGNGEYGIIKEATAEQIQTPEQHGQ